MLESFYQVGSLDGFGEFSRAMLSAAGALLGYLETTQIGNMPALNRLKTIVDASYMEIDPATRRSLELTRTLSGESRGSLLHAIDRTVTAAGGRLLAERLAAPLGNAKSIVDRQEQVAWFLQHVDMCKQIRVKMAGLSDMERIMARLSMGHGVHVTCPVLPRALQALAKLLPSRPV